MKIRGKVLLFLFSLLACTFIPLHLLFAGYNAGAFLRTGVGARHLALGATGVVFADDATALYWNPALLAGLEKVTFDTSYSNKFTSSVEYGYAGVSYKGIGVGLLRQAVGNIEKSTSLDINNRPIVEGSFESLEQAFFIGYGQHINTSISIGGNIKYLYQTLDDGKADGIGLDVGGNVTLWKNERQLLKAGLNLQDINKPTLQWSTGQRDKIPTILKCGLGYSLNLRKFFIDTVTLAVEENKRESRQWQTHVGAEVKTTKFVAIRGGYNGEQVTFGGSLYYKLFYIDYAFTPHVLGDTHWFSIGGKF